VRKCGCRSVVPLYFVIVYDMEKNKFISVSKPFHNTDDGIRKAAQEKRRLEHEHLTQGYYVQLCEAKDEEELHQRWLRCDRPKQTD
jgi:hypothetical protein